MAITERFGWIRGSDPVFHYYSKVLINEVIYNFISKEKVWGEFYELGSDLF